MAALVLIKDYMREDRFSFTINQYERIILYLPCPLTDIFRHDFIEARYVNDNVCDIVIYSHDITELVETLHDGLTQALAHQITLDALLKHGLGYEWNEYLDNHKKVSSYESIPEWIGQRYFMWSSYGIAVWLYEKENKIFLEITPTYKWHFQDPTFEEESQYITYEQFISNYKPYAAIELNTDKLQEWLEQTERLLAIINSNDERYFVGEDDRSS